MAPFTSIISQTVNKLRKAIVLADEDPYKTVVEHHHQAEQPEDDLYGKKYVESWYADVICTTAVQLFETMAGMGTRRLKKYHNIVGKTIIIDESHTSLPTYLWPVLLKYIQFLTQHCGCKFIMSSGSMVKPWEIKRFRQLAGFNLEVKPLLPIELSRKSLEMEKNRVKISYNPVKLKLSDLGKLITSVQGSKIVRLNTIQNAAAVTEWCINHNYDVLHLSTSLSPQDREETIKEVVKRLQNKNGNWILTTTSCVEAGMDFSFRYGFTENAGMISLTQFDGRVRREFEPEYDDSFVKVFELDINEDDKVFTANPEFGFAQDIFAAFYKQGKIGPEWCHEAMLKEAAKIGEDYKITGPNDTHITLGELLNAEDRFEAEKVSKFFRVIASDKQTVLVRPDILSDKDLDFNKLIRNSVQIYDSKLEKIGRLLDKSDKTDLLIWKGKYNKILGYMADPACWSK